jgi:uncharacterized protein (DUF608 family)
MIRRILSLILFAGSAVMALPETNPVSHSPLRELIPAEKHLDPAWVKSLSERGEPRICSGTELRHIGMPIGGLFAGQLYLGGDGQLWHWDIFNDFLFTGWSGNYSPMAVSKPLEQSFGAVIDGKDVPLTTNGFSRITFRGEYPMAFVGYKDTNIPVQITLTAYSPFIPLDIDDSSLPLTVMEYTVTNTSSRPVTVTLKGTLENFVLARERGALNGTRSNRVTNEGTLTLLEESVDCEPVSPTSQDHSIEDWSKGDFSGWKVEGKAFGATPYKVGSLTEDQRKSGLDRTGKENDFFVSSLSCEGRSKDAKPAGTLTSAPFTIDRAHLYLWMRPEGRRTAASGFDLLVEGKVVAGIRPQASRSDIRELRLQCLDLTPWAGKQGMIRIVDNESEPKSGITVGKMFLSDREILFNPKTGRLETRSDAEDNGSMALALLDGPADLSSGQQEAPARDKLMGFLGRTVTLQSGESRNLTFVLSWFFPNLNHIPKIKEQGRWYASRFQSAGDVIRYFQQNRVRLAGETRSWHDTWYDSTLPWWFLERTILTVDNLASSSNYRFRNGRWWAWEGVGACEGTCGHVYGYAQAVARLFPSIEREQREKVDFGSSLTPEGWIDCRGENQGKAAIDAQAMYILRALREHQTSTDNAFLARIWPGVKKATEYLIRQDPGEKGVIRGAQHNTLDADWYGEVSWYNGLYLASLQSSAVMADTMQDPAFAARCRKIAERGTAYQTANLFNGEYFQNKVDPAHPASINSGSGCEIDQVLGQSWAFQVGLPRVLPKNETVSALQSLWTNNFAPDVGPFKAVYTKGRNYAEPGEAGLLMCTFPRADWDLKKASGKGNEMYASYFNECMTGFEHQVAGHMIWEGDSDSDLVTRGLAVERAIHDRYAPAKRNPYNEVECGDHYGRSMAGYGVYLAACGYDYDGPKGYIGFAPKIHPTDFKVAFTAAEGWGSYSQKITGNTMSAALAVTWGRVSLRSFGLACQKPPQAVTVILDERKIPVEFSQLQGKVKIRFRDPVTVDQGKELHLSIDFQKPSSQSQHP